MLTAQQVAHFNTFGFLLLRQLFSPEEVRAIRQEAEALWQADRQRLGLSADEYIAVPNFIERSPALLRLAEDDRIYPAMEQLLGAGFLWGGSEGNTGVPRNKTFLPWHSDRPGDPEADYRRVKIMMYLTPVARDTGCLRVIPGSHRLPLYKDLDALNEQKDDTSARLYGVGGADLPAFPLESQPGDVVFFDHYLYHGVYGGDTTRRYIAMKFVARPTKPTHFDSLMRHSKYILQPPEAILHSDRPRLRAMTAGLAGLGATSATG